MTTLREAAQQALRDLEQAEATGACEYASTAALRAALAQREQAMRDTLTTGTGVLLGGERIDPASMYKQQEQEPVTWGVDWGRNGDQSCCTIIKRHADGIQEVVAVEYGPPRREAEQEPVACFIGAKGSAFDLPTTKRAYTYAEQPGNVAASKLGRSLETAKRCSAGDSIDAGLVLLKALQSEGFGVFQLGAEYTHPPRREWQSLSEEEIDAVWEGAQVFNTHYDIARAVEQALKEKNQ